MPRPRAPQVQRDFALHRAHKAVLQALRAGPLTPTQFAERACGYQTKTLEALQARGLVARRKYSGGKQESEWIITDKGLAACPPRNPAAAKPRHAPIQGPHVRTAYQPRVGSIHRIEKEAP